LAVHKAGRGQGEFKDFNDVIDDANARSVFSQNNFD
jgi:hypothetical protein